jgi:hypothetical protein
MSIRDLHTKQRKPLALLPPAPVNQPSTRLYLASNWVTEVQGVGEWGKGGVRGECSQRAVRGWRGLLGGPVRGSARGAGSEATAASASRAPQHTHSALWLSRTSVRAHFEEDAVATLLAAHNVTGGEAVQGVALPADVVERQVLGLGLRRVSTSSPRTATASICTIRHEGGAREKGE